jgi:hypothetical protein
VSTNGLNLPHYVDRIAAFGNAPIEFLPPLTVDPEVEVREAAQARMAEESKIQK